MDTPLAIIPPLGKKAVGIRVFGLGGAGGNAVEQMAQGDFAGVQFTVLNTDQQALAQSSVPDKVQLGAKLTRGMGTGGDPELGRAAAEADLPRLKELCAGADLIFITCGLGGGTGTGAAPVLAKVAKEAGALVLGIATLPFDWEGARRQRQAQAGLERFKAAADGVICLPNQKVCKLVDENTSMVESFKITNELLAQGVRGVWRLLSRAGLINLDFADLSAVLRGRHTESSVAAAEAMGPARAREVVEKLFAHPLLDGGQILASADAVLVSVLGGPDLTMADVNRVMEQINRQCENAHLIVGAAIDGAFTDRLAVTVVASRRQAKGGVVTGSPSDDTVTISQEETQFLSAPTTQRATTRFVPPPPATTPEQTEELLRKQGGRRRKASKMQQPQLPFEIVSKGRFEKSEPTIVKGEDLDVPTYIRRNVALN